MALCVYAHFMPDGPQHIEFNDADKARITAAGALAAERLIGIDPMTKMLGTVVLAHASADLFITGLDNIDTLMPGLTKEDKAKLENAVEWLCMTQIYLEHFTNYLLHTQVEGAMQLLIDQA